MLIMMKRYNSILQILLLLLAGCERADNVVGADALTPVIRVTTAPMTIVGEQVPYDTRASQPLNPEDENIIYTLAVLVFDTEEGVLHRFDDKYGGKYYRYIDLRNAAGHGKLTTTLPIEGLPVRENVRYTICLIGNLQEERVQNIIDGMLEDDGTAFIHEFKKVRVNVPYANPETDAPLETGHVKEVYMFGYYQGMMPPMVDGKEVQDISISMGRIISRLEVDIRVDENFLRKDYGFYMCMDNLESTAFLFPAANSPKEFVDTGIARSKNLDDGQYTLYFYSAPNGALTANDKPLTLSVWYAPDGLDVNAPTEIEDKSIGYAKIYLCNEKRGTENRNFQLNRNCVYRFRVNLVEETGERPE